ncbi:MAG: glucose-6-phosphate exchanger SLC37A4 [Ruminococcaceae bacterium]|nr:glucose-6-phosphate exchanger SLC37A4 [Oscillospiraceae bacterium]
MRTTSRRKFTILICLMLTFMLLLGSCTFAEDSGESEKLCKEFIDYALADDKASAYNMIKNVTSEEEFETVWKYMRDFLKDSTSYELKQTGWNKNVNDGVSTTTVVFEIVTDDEKIWQVRLLTRPEIEGIAGVYFTDVTEFVAKTKWTETVNIVLSVTSLAAFGFTVWMFVDCMKRTIKRKVLWAIIVCVGFAFGITIGKQNIAFDWWLGTPIASSGVMANLSSLSVTLTLAIPLGAIIYFFVRKKLPLKESAQNMQDTVSDNASLSDVNSEITAETEANTEEKTEKIENNENE